MLLVNIAKHRKQQQTNGWAEALQFDDNFTFLLKLLRESIIPLIDFNLTASNWMGTFAVHMSMILIHWVGCKAFEV